MKSFNLYLLCRKDHSGLQLVKEEAFLHPGMSSPVKSKVPGLRLMSGFPGLFRTLEVPVSPALQLNADLGDFGPRELLDIARAESNWKEHVLFRSYILEPDTRIAVFSGDAARLSEFVETWGGLLEITPVLTSGYHPSFITASSMEVRERGQGLEIILGVKSPFDLERCSYCGYCAASCPEDCLKEMLFLDFDRCSLCGACADSCPNGAIDLHATETVEFEVSAIVCLTGANLEPAGDIPLVYGEDELDSLVASMGKRQVEEVISLDPLICQHGTRLTAGCTRCLDVCREAAISEQESGLEIDQLKCVECGRCVSICPTGALQYERFNDRAFSSYAAQLDLKPGTTVAIGSAEVLHAFWWRNRTRRFKDTLFMECPSINALGLFNMLLLLSRGAGRLVFLHNEDNLEGPFLSQAALANRIMEVLFQAEEAVIPASLEEASGLLGPSRVHLSRPLPPGAFRSRRRAIERILLFLMEEGSGRGRLEPEISSSFGGLSCDTSLCTQCLSCLNECRQEALKAHEDSFVLSFKPVLCVQCGLCTATCPEDALGLEPGLVLQETFFRRDVLLEAEPARCRNCGKVFGTRKSLEKVKAILSVRQDLDMELFELCDRCRVKRFFEQEGEG